MRQTLQFNTMAKGSKKGACSAHVEAAKANCLKHDRREGKIPSYVNPHLTKNNRVVFEDEMIRGRKSIVPLVHQAEKLYTAKTGQKCQKSFTPFREDVLHIKEGVADEQLMKFKANVEALTGWKVVGIWLHQDEGHVHSKYIEGDENFEINYHAHVLYDCQDHKTGKAIRPIRDYFRKRQDILADATGMERGNPAAETSAKHRSSMEQRIFSQEQRISELERIVREKEQQHQAEMQRMADEKKKAVEKARKEATASIWHKVKNTFGADSTINDLKDQIKALQSDLGREREIHKADVKKAHQNGQKSLQDALGRIAGRLTYFPSVLTLDGVMEKIDQLLQAERMYRKLYNDAESQLKAISREEEGEEQTRHRGFHR